MVPPGTMVDAGTRRGGEGVTISAISRVLIRWVGTLILGKGFVPIEEAPALIYAGTTGAGILIGAPPCTNLVVPLIGTAVACITIGRILGIDVARGP